jgi:hypothetical protein
MLCSKDPVKVELCSSLARIGSPLWNHHIYKWIAHVVRAWDLGSGAVASWAKLLNVLSTCREWDR